MPNRLATAASPYLRQHAHNPVDWYPWGPEALERARTEDKPILLSVGYSACHWCHVMEHESFSDPATAALMNEHFVSIKVDREERPDIDELYMTAVQAFTRGHGGWPMTLFLLPDGRPFYGGTYFPPQPRYGMPSFTQVLEHAASVYAERREEAASVGDQVVALVDKASTLPAPVDALPAGWLKAAARFAGVHGAPRFPPHGVLPALVASLPETEGLVRQLLDEMSAGGMYDVLGGGFARYSVDADWLVPHFEKMLYDNAQLLPVYAEASVRLGEARYDRFARETAAYMLRDLRLEGGAFAASEDADSEGEEGRFYAWTPAQLDEVLGPEGHRAARLLGVTLAGTFEHGTSVLRPVCPLEEMSAEDREFLEWALPRLLEARSQRVRPGLDDKVVVGWNGLAISALARSGALLGEAEWVSAATRAAEYVLERGRPGGRLARVVEGPQGFLEDHALLGLGLVDLFEATAEPGWLAEALGLAESMLELFWDEEEGGFFATGHDAEVLVGRSKTWTGGATPSGNAAAAWLCTRLAVLAGREDLGQRADRVLRSLAELLDRGVAALGPALLAGEVRSRGPVEIGVVGEADDPRTQALLAAARRVPLAAVVRVDPGSEPAHLPWMLGRTAVEEPTAWVCEGMTCRLPTTDPAALRPLP